MTDDRLPVLQDDSLSNKLERLLPHRQHDEAWPCKHCRELRAAIQQALEEAERRGAAKGRKRRQTREDLEHTDRVRRLCADIERENERLREKNR